MKQIYEAYLDNIKISPLKQCDLELLRKWRNDKDISKYLSKIDYISKKQQVDWYTNYLADDSVLFWSICENNKVIGALSLYNICEDSAEIGRIMIGDLSARGKGYGYWAIILTLKIAFDIYKLSTIYLSVYEKNIPAIKTYTKVGFEIMSSYQVINEGFEYRMRISRKDFENMYNLLKIYISDGNK